jgi:hypothetical protein
MFNLKFDADNAAVEDDPRAEIARILRAVARRVDSGADFGKVADGNGNSVGSFTYEGDDTAEGDDCHQSYCAAVRHVGRDCDCEGFGEYERAEGKD